MEDDEYQTFEKIGSPFQWRVVNKLKLEYSSQNGADPDTIILLQPVLSGFELTAPDSPKAFAVLESEFYDIFRIQE